MSDVRDTIPRSTMTTEQQRRIGALQVASSLLYGTSYNVDAQLKCNNVSELLRVARFVAAGDN